MGKISKRQLGKMEELLAGFSKINGQDLDELKQQADLDTLYSTESMIYDAQSVLNFFEARIQPVLDNKKKETPEAFDARFREWRIRKCRECDEEFAYAFNYDGVRYCSLDCLERSLEKIGIKFSRGKDLKKRWGVHYHPAIVSSTALEALKTLYAHSAPEAFSDAV